MTRETKIGLVVGLAFIIVVGVLVSDHLSSVTRPPRPQQLADGSANVDRSITSPGVRRSGDRETVLDRPVDLNTRLRGAERANPVPPRADNSSNGNPRPVPVDPNIAVRPNPTDPDHTSGGRTDPPADPPHHDDPEITLPPGTALYEAKPGDTVSRLAAKFLGSNTNANRDKLISLNQTLKANPNKIVVGEVYIVPDPNARGVVRSNDRSPLVPLVGVERTDVRGNTPAPREELATISYTTRPGDTLWKIARDQCGSQSKQTVDQIKALNNDVLKGKEMLHPNLKLKIPARAVATR
ncbi:MAG: LysM domain-containing protein [Tepidisphaeraceae bacterium]|jgi:nucleoid-associated protein YgaU